MTGTFVSIDGLTYTVNVGSASGTLILGEDPVHITWAKGDHIFVSLRSRECNIRVKTSVDLSSLYTDSPLGCPVTVYQGTSCIFYGFLIPQEWDVPFRGICDEVELSAVDALAALKQLRYTAVYTNYPTILTPSSIVQRACGVVGLTGVPSLQVDYACINEAGFLPRYQDLSEYSNERKSWAEVLQAIGTYEGYVFMQDPTNAMNLLAYDLCGKVDRDTPTAVELRGSDSASSDIRMSIEPAKSRVVVSYNDLSEAQFLPELSMDRMEDATIASSSIRGGDGNNYQTQAKYYVSKDWVARDTRSAVAAVVILKNLLTLDSDEHYCIVGPAIMKYPGINPQHSNLDMDALTISMQAWARDDMDVDSNGYEILTINHKTSNFDPVVTVTVYNPNYGTTTLTKTLYLDGQEGFQSVNISLNEFFDEDLQVTAGYIRIEIPAHCVITGLSSNLGKFFFKSSDSTKVDLSKVANDGIVELTASGWNDSVNIDAWIRSSLNGYSNSDVIFGFPIWNKYPYCDTRQFEVPRRRYKATLQGIFSPLQLISDTSLSAQKLVADGGDIDLRMNRTTLDVIETWGSV